MSSPLDGNGVAWACVKCNSPRSVDPCPKCGTALTKPAEGWEWPTLPDIDRIRAVAREVGYAIGVHGSLERDLDLIAAPWVEDAVEPLVLARHIAAGLGGEVIDYQQQDKPCGRWACNIHTPDWTKLIDLSVMPPVRPLPSSHTAVEPVAWEWRAMVKGEWSLWSTVDVDPNDWTWRDYWEDVEIVPLVPLSALTAQAAARVAAERERDEAWGDLSKAAGAIGSVRFMDPPDGGDVTLAEQVARMREALEAAESEVATLKGRVAELEAGLTPSARTKAALIGEFSFAIDVMEPDADGDDAEVVSREITVPWTTIKEIMSAIRRLTHQEKNNG